MTIAIEEPTARVGARDAIDWFGKIGNVIDCVIPIVLSVIALVSFVLVAFDLVH